MALEEQHALAECAKNIGCRDITGSSEGETDQLVSGA